MIDGAPEERGVYALWEHEEVIYYGRASSPTVTIQHALREHWSGRAGACTQNATHYGWEICLDPAEREADLHAEHEARFKRLPRCNGKSVV